MAEVYDIGDVVRMSVTFTDTGAAYLDPTLVTFTVLPPGTGSTSIEVTSATTSVQHPSTGFYFYDHLVDSPGTWTYRIHSTGVGQSAGEDWFRVRHSLVTT